MRTRGGQGARLGACAALLLASGCLSTNGVEGRDGALPLPTLRASFDAVDEGEQEEFGRRTLAVEIASSYAGGDFDQGLAAGETLEYGGVTFSGPGDVDVDYDTWEVSLGARAGLRGGAVQVEAIGGVAFNHFDVDVRQGAVRARDQEDRWGPLAGLQLRLEFVPELSLYGRGTYLWAIDMASGQIEAGVDIRPLDELSLLLGYRLWRYRNEEWDEAAPRTDVDVTSTGFVLGLEARF